MKIPDNFKKKYNLTGETYAPQNVEAALSELFSVSSRLYKENADLKAELASLREQVANPEPAPAQAVDLSGIENRLAELSAKLGAIHTSVNDTLCVANDAAISAKRAESAATDAIEAVVELDNKLNTVDLTPVIVHDDTDVPKSVPTDAEYGDIINYIAEETAPVDEEQVISVEPEPMTDEEANIAEQEEAIEVVEDAVAEPTPAEEEKAAEPSEEPKHSTPVPDAIADELIRSAGLFDEPEEIEPAAAVADEDVTAKLNDMIANEPAQEPLAEEPAAPASYTDMKSALDAIRARLKK